jgi:hypothetical protein
MLFFCKMKIDVIKGECKAKVSSDLLKLVLTVLDTTIGGICFGLKLCP